ncbi:hypothetical protein ABIA39_001092 [Nocardia sp. GAS34]|uniref:ESX secretion-associated protein EspG n=1 Tax=unclassified Nocardia TaxID=2637762 RepID=UPI003D25C07F
MNTGWTLRDTEFVALLTEAKQVELPSPLTFISRTSTADEYDREMYTALQRAHGALGFDPAPMMQTLAHPDVTLEICAWDIRDPDGPEGMVRVHAARRAAHGVVVKQIPGETRWHSGGFVVTECRAPDLARVAVDQLPPSAPGTWGDVVLLGDGDGLDHSHGRSAVQVGAFAAESAQSRAVRFHAAPMSYVGGIKLRQERSAFGPRGCLSFEFDLRDLVDDGRYLLTDDNPPVAVPVDAANLIAHINTRIAAIVQALRDERAR